MNLEEIRLVVDRDTGELFQPVGQEMPEGLERAVKEYFTSQATPVKNAYRTVTENAAATQKKAPKASEGNGGRADQGSVQERVLAALENGAKTNPEIQEETGLTGKQVSAALSGLKAKDVVRKTGKRNWGVTAKYKKGEATI